MMKTYVKDDNGLLVSTETRYESGQLETSDNTGSKDLLFK